MITVDLEAVFSSGWNDNPHYQWSCPACDIAVVIDEPTIDTALTLSANHLFKKHYVEMTEIQIGLEYWALSSGLSIEKFDSVLRRKVDG